MTERAIAALVRIKDLNVAWKYITRPSAQTGLRRRLEPSQISRLKHAIKEELDRQAAIIHEVFPVEVDPEVGLQDQEGARQEVMRTSPACSVTASGPPRS